MSIFRSRFLEKEHALAASKRCSIFCQNGDDAVHRSTKIPVCVLNTAIRSWGSRLVVIVKMSVETAIVNEGAGVRKMQRESAGLTTIAVSALQEYIRAIVASCIEEIVAYDCVIVGI